ncbi:hypothetical protein N0V82_001454 [Gnomoniopsis sp. IMI 355080]|nr:hypothetical protein N0V82_001454 [Gnomoniopsis sp. IMI 355080]
MPVVYNGTPGAGKGDLFQGLKLWIAQRVPQRARWIELVKGNGGEIVRLEKNADMLIADNIKVAGVSPPLGSYMWRWIDDSVKNGFLQDKDDYLIGRREGSARDLATSQPTKVGRTPFTNKDDLILTKWVLAEERRGNLTSGNVIYKALERKYPHHTWQSWRDRWVKGLRSKPRPAFSEEEIQAEIDEHGDQSPEPGPGPASASRRPQTIQAAPLQSEPSNNQNEPATPSARVPIPATPTSSRPSGSKGRTFFTEEEDRLLVEFIEEVRRNNRANNREENKNLGGNVIYQDFANKAVDDAGPDEASNAGPDPEAARHVKKRQTQQPRVGDTAKKPLTNGISTQTTGPSAAQEQPNLKSDQERLNRKLRKKKEARAAMLIEKTWRGHAVRRDMAKLEAAVVPLQSRMRGFMARMRMASLAEAHQAEVRKADNKPDEADLSQDDERYEDAAENLQGADVSSQATSVAERDPREQFYEDLEVVSKSIDAEIESKPIINGQRIDLWDIYRLARQQSCDLEARDWKLVTEGLGFEPAKGLAYKVQACYLQNLAEFEEYIMTFESNGGIDEDSAGGKEEEEEETGRDTAAESLPPTSDFATAPKQPVNGPSSPAYQSSPPLARSKRSHEQTDLLRSDSCYPSSGPRKRRRVDRNSVIPPTPDEKLGVSNNSLNGTNTHNHSSPLKSQALVDGNLFKISSDDDSDGFMSEVMDSVEVQNELPASSKTAKKRFVEPETQDWQNPHDLFLLTGEDDVSPSQQLLLESDAFTSPQHVVSSSRGVVATEQHASSPAAEVLEEMQAPSTRVLRSNPRRPAEAATLSSPSRAPIGVKVKKRTLPGSYKDRTATKTAATSTTTVPGGQPVLHSTPQPNDKAMTRPASTTSARVTSSNMPRPRRVNAETPTPAMRSSTSRSLAFSPVEAPQLMRNEQTLASLEFESLDEAYVVAQFRHFEALGYKTGHISRAMEAGTMMRGPMIVALQNLHEGKGLPENEPGVWTPQDCDDLLMVKKYERQVGKGKAIAAPADSKMKVVSWKLKKKHGENVIARRWEFMRASGKMEGI